MPLPTTSTTSTTSTLQPDLDALRAYMEPLFARRFSEGLARAYSYIDQLCLQLCLYVAHECAVLTGRPEPFPDLAARIGLAPDAAYFLTAVLDILAEEGFAVQTPHGWAARRPCPADDSARLQREARAACPGALATFELIERCHRDAPAFLRGEKPGLTTIFPHGDMRVWERLHSSDEVMSLYADLMPPALAAVVGRGARLLEVGAGVGAVAQRALPLLRERDVAEYWFTDLGQLFVQRARDLYADEPFMRFARLNLDDEMGDQGLALRSFDVVLGVNVLHIARDLAGTLRALHALLKRPGWLILAEGSPPDRRRRWRLDLVFAFLRGWWDVELDPKLRPRPGFLLPSEWRRILLDSGFDRVYALPGEDWFAGPCRGGLLIAEKAARCA